MNKRKAVISLAGYEDIFEDSMENGEREEVVRLPISQFHMFRNHPFRVVDDEKMEETVKSVKQYGILIPGIVRPLNTGGYEVIAGHRRWRACELAGLKEMPVLVRNMTDEEATVIMVDTNIQREDILRIRMDLILLTPMYRKPVPVLIRQIQIRLMTKMVL